MKRVGNLEEREELLRVLRCPDNDPLSRCCGSENDVLDICGDRGAGTWVSTELQL